MGGGGVLWLFSLLWLHPFSPYHPVSPRVLLLNVHRHMPTPVRVYGIFTLFYPWHTVLLYVLYSSRSHFLGRQVPVLKCLSHSTLIKKNIKYSLYIRKFRVEQLQSHIWLTASSYMGKYLRISSYIRKSFLIYDFAIATAPLWISLYMRKILFCFLSVY